jgi:transcriptional regulator with XRE-family HTH domain
MTERIRFSVDELKKIGWRIKSVRSLTGMNQEEFSLASNIPHMTVKGWELGRALPRADGINRILSALNEHNIQITPEWIIFGEGAGPVYQSAIDGNDIKKSSQREILINAFKNEQRKNGANSIIVEISDSLMSPKFHAGDIAGGIIMSVNGLRARYSSEEISNQSWLIPLDGNKWAVRDIFFDGENLYTKQMKSSDILKSDSLSIGKIIWHYFSTEQT